MTKIPSFTWAAGVLSKGLWGRADLQKYQTGLKYARNFIISVEGGIEKRFGTYLIGKRKYQNSTDYAKLVPWRISNDDSYVLEFGHNYIRFIRLGGYVTIPSGHVPASGSVATNVSGFMEVPTSYNQSDLSKIKFTFANDIMYINITGYAEYQLQRLGLYDWKFVETNFDPHPVGPTITNLTWHNNLLSADNYTPELVDTSYMVSATLSDGTETKPSAISTISADTGHQRLYVSIEWSAVSDAIQYTIYKGKNGVFGFIGYVQATSTLRYEDRNLAPSYDVVPLDKLISLPGTVGVSEFYKQRRVFGGFSSKPQNLILSRPLILNSLYTSSPSQDDDAIDITLVGRERHTINHMLELRKFIIFTDSAEWILGTSNNEALSPSSIDPTIETKYGASPYLRPIPLGERIIFVQNISGNIRDMGYEYTTDSFKADDLSRLARDLFKNKSIVAWDSAQYPLNLIPCVVSDGTVNNLTYAREHEIWGWADMNTQGDFLDVACVTEGSEHAIYYQVKRTINGVTSYFVERLEINYNGRIEDMVYVDCALTYKSALNFLGLTRISETQINYEVPLHGYSVGNEVQLEIDSGEIIRGKIENIVGSTVHISPLRELVFPEDLAASGVSYKCTNTVSGLSHLDNADIWVLADGKVFKKLKVSGGVLTFPSNNNYARVHVGLSYQAYAETLDLDVNQMVGTYTNKTIDDIIIHLRNSRGVWAGPSASTHDLQVIKPRNRENMYDANSPLDGPYELSAHVDWKKTAGVRIESRDPLPCNVLNIVPDMKYGS